MNFTGEDLESEPLAYPMIRSGMTEQEIISQVTTIAGAVRSMKYIISNS
jgi:hypothetical protein